jgi:hypothetical protein
MMMPVTYGAPPPQPTYGGPGITAGLSLVTALVHSGHDRIAFGFDWIPIPIPIPRIFCVPGEQTVTMAQPQVPANFGAAPPVVYGAAPPVYQMPAPVLMPSYGAPPQQPCGYGQAPPCGSDRGYGQGPGKDSKDGQSSVKESLDSVEKKLQLVEKMLKEKEAREKEKKSSDSSQ